MNDIIETQIISLIWEMAGEFFESNKIKSRLYHRKNDKVP